MTDYTDQIRSSEHLLLRVIETGTSQANNTSTVTAELYLIRDSGSGFYSNYTTNTWSMTINGTKYSGSGTYDLRGAGSDVLIAKKTLTIAHASNGTKTITLVAKFDDPNAGGIGSGSISDSKVLTTLPQVPGTPSNNGATAVSGAGFTGNFTTGVIGGSAITSSTMQVSTDPTFATGVTTVTGGAIGANTAGSLNFTTGTAGIQYYFRFRVTNTQGASGWSAVQSATLATTATAPHIAVIPRFDGTGFYLILTPPFGVSAGSVTSYTVTRTVSGPGAPAPVTITTATPTNNFDPLVLVAGQTVSYRATALIGGSNTGSSSTISSAYQSVTVKSPMFPLFSPTFVPPYLFGDTQDANAVHINLAQNPSLEGGTTAGYVAVSGTTGVSALTVAAPAVSTPYGTQTLKQTWSTASTSTTGAGTTNALNTGVVAGQPYSFGIGHVRNTGATQKLALSVDWLDVTNAVLSTVTSAILNIVSGGQDDSGLVLQLVNQIAPANAVKFTMKVLSATGGVVWGVGAILETDGWYGCLGATLPPLSMWGSLYGVGVLYSTSPIGWRTFAQGDDTATLAGQIIQLDTELGLNDAIGDFDAVAVYGSTQVTGVTSGHRVGTSSGVASRMAVVYPTANYFAAIDAMTDNTTVLAAEIEWYDSNLNLLSRVQGPTATMVASVAQTLSVAGVCPAGAAYAAVDTVDIAGAGWNAGSLRFVSDAILTASNAEDYFDGSFPDDAQYTYAWQGTANASPSIRSPRGSLSVIDPDAAVIPSAPQPPQPQDSVILDDVVWDRYVALIPASSVREWIAAVPTLSLYTNLNEERQVRIRYYSNPSTLDPSVWTDDGQTPDFEQIISYIPDNATFTIDGVAQRAFITYASGPFAGQEIPSDSFLFGQGGGPSDWPALMCGTAYMLTFDVPIGATPNNLTAVLSLTDRI